MADPAGTVTPGANWTRMRDGSYSGGLPPGPGRSDGSAGTARSSSGSSRRRAGRAREFEGRVMVSSVGNSTSRSPSFGGRFGRRAGRRPRVPVRNSSLRKRNRDRGLWGTGDGGRRPDGRGRDARKADTVPGVAD